MTTETDITNRALQLIGTRTTVTSLAESSNEASQANLVFAAVRDWCLGVTNWNFARQTALLTLLNSRPLPPVVPWNGTVSPPWLYEYQYPTDGLKIQYVTNSEVNSAITAWVGEPKRFVVAYDINGAILKQVILTNETNAIAVYTARIIDPTKWPWMFERFMVSALAWTLAPALTSDKEVISSLDATMMRFLSIGLQANLEEGLSIGDTTPEWIQTLGINYPNRLNAIKPSPKQRQPDGN